MCDRSYPDKPLPQTLNSIMKTILVTGGNGFIGRNLVTRLESNARSKILNWNRSTSDEQIDHFLQQADVIISLAGVNRPATSDGFMDNVDFHESLVARLVGMEKKTPIAFSSSIQATNASPYGKSKNEAEESLASYSSKTGAPVAIYRLPNVFGKWGRPNYNSAVNTFCYNIGRNIPIEIHNPEAALSLVYIDDVVEELCRFADFPDGGAVSRSVFPVYSTTVGEVADLIRRIAESRDTLVSERVGSGLERAIYSTYLSYLPKEAFSYSVTNHSDQRGSFVEMLKTKDSGQFSFFTAHPGITRGGHYHHTKTEKFLVLKGQASFRFRNLIDDEILTIDSSGDQPMIVETIPGWAHEVTNVGDDELICMLWANEIFDRNKPDTYACKV